MRDAGCVTHHSSRITHHASRITHHASRITHHASRITHHASRITHHASRITHHASRITHHASRITHHVLFHMTSSPFSCRASTRARTNSKSERRFRKRGTSVETGSVRLRLQTRRSAGRVIVRARWQLDVAGPPAGSMNSFSDGKSALK